MNPADKPEDAATARLLVTCPDQPGIISAVSTFLYNHGANITDLDQHSSDHQDGTFFLRLELTSTGPTAITSLRESNLRFIPFNLDMISVLLSNLVIKPVRDRT